mmetsp:Transcript_12018/g.35651  ORF Transcript_12018/g.35651 Transcript_12018/m.35651 type:complete len:202 (+) Transcript_12018:375-980(+)
MPGTSIIPGPNMAPWPGSVMRGAAFVCRPTGTSAMDRSETTGAAGAAGADAEGSPAFAAESAKARGPVLAAPPFVRALVAPPPPMWFLGRGTSIERMAPNCSPSRRMSAQISLYEVSSTSSSAVTMFFKYRILLGTTRAPIFCTLATKPSSITSSGFLTLSFFEPSSRPSRAARACCCVIRSQYSKKTTPTDLPSSSFCIA